MAATHTDKLEALKAKIAANAGRAHDLVADTRKLSMVPAHTTDEGEELPALFERMHIEGQGLHAIGPHAHKQLAEWAGIPAKYYDRMRADAPELLAASVNHWFRHEPARRMLRTLKPTGETPAVARGLPVVRAFLSDRYRRVDHDDVANVALPALLGHPAIAFDQCDLTEARMYVKAWLPTVKGYPRDGDLCYAGVIISNSEVGLGSIAVDPLVRREACGNNLLLYGSMGDRAAVQGMRVTHLGPQAEQSDKVYAMLRDETREATDKALLMQIGDVVRGLLSAELFEKTVALLKGAAADEMPGAPIAAVEVLAKKTGLTEGERDGVLEHFLAGRDRTRYGLMNAVTRMAQDAKGADRQTELEQLGGKLLALPKAEWKELAHATAN